MSLVLGDNFSYQGAKPLDKRNQYDTVAIMAAVSDTVLYDGCLTYCLETGKTYQWLSTNTVDATLGKWREFLSGGSDSSVDLQFFYATLLKDEWTSQNDEYYTQNVEAEGMKNTDVPMVYLADEADEDAKKAFTYVYKVDSDEDTLTFEADQEPVVDIPVTGLLVKSAIIQKIQVTTPPRTVYKAGTALDYTGIVVKAVCSSGLMVDVTDECTFSPASGTITTEDTTEITISYTNNDETFTTTQPIIIVKIVPFATGTDAEIKAMLDAYYNDYITWADMGWQIEDTRKIHLNAIEGPAPNHYGLPAQDFTVTITDHDKEDLATPINGHTKGCISVNFRELLSNGTLNYIHVNGDSGTDYSFTKWANLYMRTYLNSTIWGAIPSGDFKSAIKASKHNRLTTNGNNPTTANKWDGSKTDRTTEVVIDYLYVPSYTQIYGNVLSTSYLGGATPNNEEGEQLEYYKTASNRIKHDNNNGSPSSTAREWWTGSPCSLYDSVYKYYWLHVNAGGSVSQTDGKIGKWLSPAFVM